jgi:hypothetical protein
MTLVPGSPKTLVYHNLISQLGPCQARMGYGRLLSASVCSVLTATKVNWIPMCSVMCSQMQWNVNVANLWTKMLFLGHMIPSVLEAKSQFFSLAPSPHTLHFLTSKNTMKSFRHSFQTLYFYSFEKKKKKKLKSDGCLQSTIQCCLPSTEKSIAVLLWKFAVPALQLFWDWKLKNI